MKKEYLEPFIEVQKFSFEEILAETLTESGYPIEEEVATEDGGEVDL